MRGGPSFHRINYSVRTNKSIERKLVFERLAALNGVFRFAEYRYIGFGSMWFVDFVLAHRHLGIKKMWSIEKTENAERADFNKPYECIEIKGGTCTKVLEGIEAEDWQNEAISWFDYDGVFDEDTLNETELFLKNAKTGSILLISVNANRSNYRRGAVDDPEPVIDSLRSLLGQSVPANVLEGNQKDVQASVFPSVLATSILNFFAKCVHVSGRSTEGYQDRFVPLFSIVHADNAPICTVGGIVINWRQMQSLEKFFESSAERITAGEQALKDVVDLIPITPKEKLALDSLLPAGASGFGDKIVAAGLKLDEDVAEKYRRLYRYFPLFLETVF